eukprot:6239405-Pyramimonas_sp.AAC.1
MESRPSSRTWKQNKEIKRAAKRDREYFGPKKTGPAPPPPQRPGGGGRGRPDRGKGRGKGRRPRLSPEQLMKITRCGICKEKGHWHRECPNKDDPKFKKRGLAAYTFDGV